MIKFNEFVSGQKLYDVKKIGLKPGSEGDDCFIKNKLYMDMNRAVGALSQRSSYALLYVNNMFIGRHVYFGLIVMFLPCGYCSCCVVFVVVVCLAC